uniref:Uncharacterized protein n=1 Tax=Arundo donax TaxID=35708 RepID=A0A0A9EVM6_ARUDO
MLGYSSDWGVMVLFRTCAFPIFSKFSLPCFLTFLIYLSRKQDS